MTEKYKTPRNKQSGVTLTADNTCALARKSTSDETAAKSLEDQIESCFETAEEWGLPLTQEGVLVEKAGLSGNSPWEGYVRSGLEGDDYKPKQTRPALTKMMKGILAGTTKCVICWAQDRLWRSTALCSVAIDIMGDKGCLLFDRYGPVDVISAEGRAKVLDNANHAQNQRERAREDTTRGKSKSRRKGERIVTANVIGFRNDPSCRGGVIHVEDEQEFVRRIFRLFLVGEDGSGPLSPQKIALKLMGEGFCWLPDRQYKHRDRRSKHTKDVVYTYSVNRTLVNCRYIGLQSYGGSETPCAAFLNNGQTVVPLADFEMARKKVLDLKRGSNATRNSNALASLIRCGMCGQTMSPGVTSIVTNGIEGLVHAWHSMRHGSWCWCTHILPVLQFPILDGYIDTVLAPLLLAEIEEKSEHGGQAALRDQKAILCRELAEVSKKLETELPATLAKCIAEGVSVKMVGAMEKVLETQTEDLKARLRSVEAALAAMICGQEHVSNINAVSPSMRRDALRAVLRWVAVVPSNLPKMRDKTTAHQWVSNADAGRLLLMTSWGALHTACIYRTHVPGQMKRICKLRPATPAECVTSVAQMPDPDAFLAGLRRAYASNKYEFNLDEVAPGYSLQVGADPVAEFDVQSRTE